MTGPDGERTSLREPDIDDFVPPSIEFPLSALNPTILLESSPDAIVIVDSKGRVAVTNTHAEIMFGYEHHELLGRPVETLIPDRYRDRHVSHRDRFATEPRPRPMGTGLELMGRRKDSSEFPVEISLSPLQSEDQTYFFAAIRDVTARVAADSESLAVRGSIDAAHDALFMIDPDTLRFSYANQGAINQLGFERDEFLAMSVADIAPGYSDDRFRQLLAPLLDENSNRATESVSITTVYSRKCGTEVPVDIVFNYPPAPRSDIDRHIVALARDISARRKVEIERDRGVRWLQSLAALRSTLMSDPPLHEVLSLACQQSRQLTDSHLAAICETTIDATGGRRLRFRYFDSIESESLLASKRLATSDLVDQALAGTPAILNHRRQGTPLGDGNRQLTDQFDQLLMIPIEGVGSIAGLLVIGRRSAAEFTDDEISVATSLAAEAHNAYSLTDARRTKIQVKILEDRERLAQDLHDLVIQRIFAAGLRLQSIQEMAEEGIVRDRVADTISQLDETIAELRNAIFRLNTPTVSGGNRLKSVVNNAASHLGFRPTLNIAGSVDGLPPTLLDQLEPALSEILANVHRHAAATEVDIFVAIDDGSLAMSVSDNGVGFALDAPRGNGLDNLEARASKVGGDCTVASTSGEGTMITWTATF